ncbi:MAG TPA: metal-dependent hydrolase [Planctomycetota bacterium]|nr:metal-dependent hydrolase [Planctomycetota bacterium]
MLPLGHTGITALVARRLDRAADLRAVAIAAVLPDLVDKPIAFLFPGFARGWTRLAGHSLLFLALFALVAGLAWRRRALVLVLACALHLVLDLNFDIPHTTFWPFLGLVPPPHPVPYMERLWEKLNLYTLGGEVAGAACWAALWWEVRRSRERR